MTKTRNILLKILISTLTPVIMLVIGEMGLRCIRLIRPPLSVTDERLGWRSNENVRREKKGRTLDGKSYNIIYETGKNGFRIWGDPSSHKKKVLVVGDSYTEARQVSNDKTYYALLADANKEDIELFAYGSGGYGTLQEYMVLRDYWDIIKPDIVIWQWCINDFCNNSFAMDSRTSWNFNVSPRPFLENNAIRIRYPHDIPILSRHSMLWRAAAPRLFLSYLSNLPSPVDTNDIHAPCLEDAIATTDRILSLADPMLSKVPVYVFTIGQQPAYLDAFRGLARKHGYKMVEVEAELGLARKKGIVVDGDTSSAYGGHWCEEGHRVVSEILDKAIKEDGRIRDSRCETIQVNTPDDR